jgi:hypothetical protein
MKASDFEYRHQTLLHLVIAKGYVLESQGGVLRYPLHLFATLRLCVIIFFHPVQDLRDTVL